MPKKIREIKGLLLQAGFTYLPAKGSHSKWIHPKLSTAVLRWVRYIKNFQTADGRTLDADKSVPHLDEKRYKAIIIAGKDSSDAKLYLEKQVNDALEQLKEMEDEEQEE